jgi:hypothetical protein
MEKEFQMSNESIDEDVSGRVNRAEKLVEGLIARMETYHAHKETMAHSGLLVMLALLGSVLNATSWPPQWVGVPLLSEVLSKRCVAFIGLLFLWLLLHFYIRWQLRLKRDAAITQAGAEHALAEWVLLKPQNNDLGRYSPEKECTLLNKFADFLIPWLRGTTVHYNNFPKWLGDAIKQEEEGWKKKKWTSRGELLETAGSGFIFLVIILRTFHC